ncbi:hypothetical protein FRB95_008326 [Tulasnella sp. JGI-2019a]|nr:hypothetical protein FRB95_008326 [Tulasnella sp. JGI-2019a]
MRSFATLTLLALGGTVHGLVSPVCRFIVPTAYTFASTPGTVVENLQLGNSTGTAVLEQSGYDTRTTFADSQIGIYTGCTTIIYLDVGPLVSGKRALTWSSDENTGPALIGNFSSTVEDASGAPAQFLACDETAGVWTLFLGTGAAAPTGCVATELATSADVL